VAEPTPFPGDLQGQVAVVTGASAGIGKAAALGLSRLGAHVVLAVRDRAKGEKARAEIASATQGPSGELLLVDLQSQASIRRAAAELLARHRALHVLVNNAGVWLEQRHLSPDGIETTWATNVLGYHLFTTLLLPALERGAPARVVNVASEMAGDLDLDDVQLRRRPYSGRMAYAQSKQADRMWTWALARRLEGRGVAANAMHPGFVASEIFKKSGGILGRAISLYAGLRALSPAEGADTVLWLAAAPQAAGLHGRFVARRRERTCRFRDESGEEALFALCERMTHPASA
jgi:NAD(P)-dependent dehydrogenase (short-subunit alcohol dehydrogenase family)